MARKVLLTTPRFLMFEAFIREFLRDRDCEVVEHDAHDMQQILACDVALNHTFATTHCIEYVPLQKLLPAADFVSLHCPLVPATRRLMNDKTLALMKRTAYLINTARGPVVDEAALARALGAGTIAGAALDVFEAEPSISAELRELPNVILTPHMGGSADEALARMMELALLNVTQVLDGAEPVCRVN